MFEMDYVRLPKWTNKMDNDSMFLFTKNKKEQLGFYNG